MIGIGVRFSECIFQVPYFVQNKAPTVVDFSPELFD